jgi:integrase
MEGRPNLAAVGVPGLRIGELVSLRWPNADLDRRHVRVIEFTSTLGHDLVASTGKRRGAVRTVDLDDGLVSVLRKQKVLQAEERLAATAYHDSATSSPRPWEAATTRDGCTGPWGPTPKSSGCRG